MDKFKILLIQEFLQQVKSFKFSLMVVLTLIVTVFTAYVQVIDFKERYQNYQTEALKTTKEAKEACTFAELQVPVIIPPNPLSIFSKGLDEKAGNKIVISMEDLPVLETVSQKKNPFMVIFMNFDLVSIVKIILSLMAVYLIADTISGEREEETLKMVFMNRITRLEFFLAKYVAALIVITIPLLGIFLFSSVFISLQPLIQLTAMQWFRIFLIFLSALGFLSIFILIGLWISMKSLSSSQAMIYGLLFWITVVFVYPNLSVYVVSRIVNTPSQEELKSKVNQVYNEFGDKLIADFDRNYPKGQYYFQNQLFTSSIEFINKDQWSITLPYKSGITSKFKLEFDAGQVKRMIPVLLEYQDRMMDIYEDYRNKLLKQKEIVNWVQIFTPGFLLDETSEDLANTSYNNRVMDILQKAREYRTRYIDYIKLKNGFGSKYFTQIPPDLWTDDKNEYKKPEYDIYRNPDTYPRLNLSDIPKFPVMEEFRVSIGSVFIVLVNLALLFLVSHAFLSFSVIKN